MRYRLTLLIFSLLLTLTTLAQDLTVRAMSMNVGDLSASTFERKDFAQRPCALVKVQLAAYGAQFEGNVVGDVVYKTGEYWVYMSEGSQELRIKHPSYLPLHVKFSNYGIGNGVAAKQTYTLTLVIPQTIGMDMDDGMRYLAMTVEPTNATVYIDNNLQTLENGTLSLLLPMGQHEYRVEAQAYETKTGTFTIGYETLQLPIKLESAMASLNISTTTQGTQIYVNDQMRGTSSWNGILPPGSYRVEGRLQGYRNYRQNITLAQRDRQQLTIPALQAITGVLNVNYQPLNAEVWIDGKKVGASPNVFRNIIIGNHNVELRANGYDNKKLQVTIEEGKTAMLTGTLSKTATANSNTSNSQSSSSEIKVVSFKLLETDLTANTRGTERMDQNAEKAALIKIVTSEKGFSFDGGSLGIVDTEQHTGEIWVYVPRRAQKLSISHPVYGVLHDYYYPVPIQGGRTYEMVLEDISGKGRTSAPQTSSSVSSGKIIVKGTVFDQKDKEPIIGASIVVKGTTIDAVTDFDGNFTLHIPSTDNNIKLVVKYVSYKTQTIDIDKSNNPPLKIYLKK